MASKYQPSDDLDLSHFSFGRGRGNLTPPDGMIRVGSAFPSGIVSLESLWEGAKILVADWINHLPMLVIDGPNQPIR